MNIPELVAFLLKENRLLNEYVNLLKALREGDAERISRMQAEIEACNLCRLAREKAGVFDGERTHS